MGWPGSLECGLLPDSQRPHRWGHVSLPQTWPSNVLSIICQIAKHKMTPTLAGMSWNVNSLSFFNSTSMCRARCMPSISSTCGPLQKPTSSLILQKFSQRFVLVNDVSIKNRLLSENLSGTRSETWGNVENLRGQTCPRPFGQWSETWELPRQNQPSQVGRHHFLSCFSLPPQAASWWTGYIVRARWA